MEHPGANGAGQSGGSRSTGRARARSPILPARRRLAGDVLAARMARADPGRAPSARGPPRASTRSARGGLPWSPDRHPPPASASGARLPGGSAGWRLAGVSLAAALVGAVIGGGIVAAASDQGGGTVTIRQISAGPALLNGTTNIESVIDKVLPAVVSIDATVAGSRRRSRSSEGSVGSRRTRGPG